MVAEHNTEKNLMAGTWTKAALVRRSFKAGPKRKDDLVYDAERAVLEARVLFIKIRAAMLQADIPTTGEDVKVAVAMMTPDSSSEDRVYLVPMRTHMDGLPRTYARAADLEANQKAVPLGIVIWQWDREAEGLHVWVQPWLVNPRAARAAIAARLAFLEGKETDTAF